MSTELRHKIISREFGPLAEEIIEGTGYDIVVNRSHKSDRALAIAIPLNGIGAAFQFNEDFYRAAVRNCAEAFKNGLAA